MKESVVQIGGHRYRYVYDHETHATVYKGPVGSAPDLSEEEFLTWMLFDAINFPEPDVLEDEIYELVEGEEITPEEAMIELKKKYPEWRNWEVNHSQFGVFPGDHTLDVWGKYSWNLHGGGKITFVGDEDEIGEFNSFKEMKNEAADLAQSRKEEWQESDYKDPKTFFEADPKVIYEKKRKEYEEEE